MLRRELPYLTDSSTLFAKIVQQPWAIYLDSGRPGNDYGHYDIMVADPVMTFTTRGGVTEIVDQHGVRESSDDPFLLLKQALQQDPCETDLPFTGGAVGYFGYDLARSIETLSNQALDGEHIPEMMVGIYDWAIIVDHRKQQSWLVCCAEIEQSKARWEHVCALLDNPDTPETAAFAVHEAICSNIDVDGYQQASSAYSAIFMKAIVTRSTWRSASARQRVEMLGRHIGICARSARRLSWLI